MIKRFLDKKISEIKSLLTWGNLFTITIPMYFYGYWWIFELIGAWDNFYCNIKKDILQENNIVIVVVYLMLVWVSMVVTSTGIMIWERRVNKNE